MQRYMFLLPAGKATTGHSITSKKCRRVIEKIERRVSQISEEHHGLKSKGFRREIASAGLKAI
jgi:hypothetical protein